jgi:hypothetical protein
VSTGWGNVTGSNNTLLGSRSNVGASNLNFATAIGAGAVVGASNTVVLGRSADTVQVPGALNVAGTFGANILNATTQFNLDGNRVLSVSGTQAEPNSNLIAGVGAGASNPTGTNNSFFGAHAGSSTTQGSRNAFFGVAAGFRNTTGGGNAFFGTGAGFQNTTGGDNTFIGPGAGGTNTTGANNIFIGPFAGGGNTTGNGNTVIGLEARVGAGDLTAATAIGAGAVVNSSNTVVLGRSADTVQVPGVLNVSGNVGIGTATSSAVKLNVLGGSEVAVFASSISGSGVQGQSSSDTGVGGVSNSGIGVFGSGKISFLGQGTSFFGGDTTPLPTNVGRGVAIGYTSVDGGYVFAYDSSSNTPKNLFLNQPGGNVGIGTTTPARTLHVAGRARVGSIPQEPSGAQLCFNVAGDLLQCGASSLRLKTNVQPFVGGLDIIRRLRPISFDWKDGSGRDIGLGAEDVAQVAPSFTFTDEKGEPAGVKYERLNMLLINAVKEQQAQIESLRVQNNVLSARLRGIEKHLRKKVGLRRSRSQRKQI